MKDYFFLPRNASKARLREAENARKNRAEIVRAFSQGKVSRRDLIKWGLITTAGTLAPISGLSPFAQSVYADSNIPTGAAQPAVWRTAIHTTDATLRRAASGSGIGFESGATG